MQKLRWGFFIVVILLSALVLFACTDSTEDDEDLVVAADVSLYDANQSIDLGFPDGTEEYRLIALWPSEEDASMGYVLNVSEDAAAAEDGDNTEAAARLRPVSLFAAVKPPHISGFRHQQILRKLEWDRKMRAREQEIISNKLISVEDFVDARKRSKASADCADNELARGDECLNEFDLVFTDFDGNRTDITVAVRGKGNNVSVVVDVDDNGDVSDDDIAAIVEKFDGIIYPRDHFLYGSSVYDINGNNLDLTDRDQDGLRMIVLTHLVNESGAVGLFNPNDFLGANDANATNTSDILWAVVPDSDNSLDSIFGTIAHEYFHQIIFAVKGLKYSKIEAVWLNESLAHLAEDCSGFGIDNINTAAAYLSNSTDYSFAFSGDSIEARGMGYLFLRYLFEQKGAVEYSDSNGADLTDDGGAAFLKSMIATDKIGFENLDAALGGSWQDQFFPFLAAVTLDDLPIANDPKYRYDDLYNDPLTGQAIGVCTNCTRSNAEGSDVAFTGLASSQFEDGYEGLVIATGIDAVSVTGDSGSSLSISPEPEDEESNLKFGLVRVK